MVEQDRVIAKSRALALAAEKESRRQKVQESPLVLSDVNGEIKVGCSLD